MSYINPHGDKKQLGQERFRGRRKESQRKRGSDGRTQGEAHSVAETDAQRQQVRRRNNRDSEKKEKAEEETGKASVRQRAR